MFLQKFGSALARYLTAPRHEHNAAPRTSIDQLRIKLRPADVLLVEGSSRTSVAIKYLTQSSWSHAAIYVGSLLAESGVSSGHCIVEADANDGVRSAGLEQFESLHWRICRPIGLSESELRAVANYCITRIGHQYDMRNVFDLARYLLPTPPVPLRWRRRMISLGSGDPTRAICSTLIAQAFQSIRYPILPIVETRSAASPDCLGCIEELMRIRHHSLFTPRDFDMSPYFAVLKPTIESGFDFRSVRWAS